MEEKRKKMEEKEREDHELKTSEINEDDLLSETDIGESNAIYPPWESKYKDIEETIPDDDDHQKVTGSELMLVVPNPTLEIWKMTEKDKT